MTEALGVLKSMRKVQTRAPAISRVKFSPSDTQIPINLQMINRGQITTQQQAQSLINHGEVVEGLRRLREQESELPDFEIEAVMMTVYTKEDLEAEGAPLINNISLSGPGSVNDPRLGVVEDKGRCVTCQDENVNCPGHLGMIDFKDAMIYHPLFMRTIIQVLNCVCVSCGKLRVSQNRLIEWGLAKEQIGTGKIIPRYSGDMQLQKMEEKLKECRKCDSEQVKEAKPCEMSPEYLPQKIKEKKQICYKIPSNKKDDKEYYNCKTVKEVYDILKNITDEDARLMGFFHNSHPRRLILRALPVISRAARQPHQRDGKVYQNPLTLAYIEIIKQVLKYEQASVEKKEKERSDALNGLFRNVEKFIDNTSDKGKFSVGNRPLESLKQMLQGKEGIIRGLLMGKRVNYSARTVISPDPSIPFGLIRIPEMFASVLTRSIKVTGLNLDAMNKRLEQGKINAIYPGNGKYAGDRVVLKNLKKIHSIKIGDTVERWLEDGDYILLNRQPTLHKQGMMGFEVRLGKEKTIGLHPSYTTPFNADFDGDEMATHLIQSIMATAEVAGFVNVTSCIMNPQTNTPNMGLVMDTLTGSFKITDPKIMVEEDDMSYYLGLITQQNDLDSLRDRLNKYNIPVLSGQAIFSALLPADFNYTKEEVVIKEGILLRGRIGKPHVGPGAGNSIIQILWRENGPQRTAGFFTDATYVINAWLTDYGFSVGISDCLPPDPKLKESIQEEITKWKLEVSGMGIAPSDPLEAEKHERQILASLNNLKTVGRNILADYLPPDNAYFQMVKAGAKGSELNIAQIMGFIGQQNINGRRFEPILSGGRRCLPSQDLDTTDIEDRGFCVQGFMEGLSPQNYFFHLAGTRPNIVDTAIKTADVGYLHRKLVKAIEDFKVEYDFTVRNSANIIVQFVYGEDGFDATELITTRTKMGTSSSFIDLKATSEKINTMYGF